MKIEYRVYVMAGFLWQITINHRIKLLINHREAICIIQKASKTRGIVIQTLFQEEMPQVFRDKQAAECLLNMAKMLRSKVRSPRRSSIILQIIMLCKLGLDLLYLYFKIQRLQIKSLVLLDLLQLIPMLDLLVKLMKTESLLS